ncbi:unnamed protein product [Closterium sp. NIES-65]|nr:unnamed protein product [Closterium sp. NIES-65]
MEASASSSPDAVDMLPAALWLRIFHHLHLPPSHPDHPAICGQRHTPRGLATPIIERTGARDQELFSIYAPPGCEQSGDPAGVSFEAPIIERTGARGLERFSIYMSPSSGSELSGGPAGSTQSGGSSDQLTAHFTEFFPVDCEPLGLRDDGLTATEQWADPAGSTRSEISGHLTGFDIDCEILDSRCEGGSEEGGSEEGGSEEGGSEEGGSEEGGTGEGGTGESPTAREQYEKNSHTFGASWPLLCCALASKRLLYLVIAFSVSARARYLYNAQRPQWMRTIRFFLAHPGLHSLHLRFSNPEHLPTLGACIARSSPSLSSLRLELQGTVDFKEQQNEHWTLGFLRPCGQLQELNLGLTLERVAFKNVSFQFLDSISPQLHEFTLYEESDLIFGPRLASHTLALSFRFRFANSKLKLTLTVSPALKTLSVMAKQLSLNCKSTAPLALHHLSLYGQEQLVISSLPLASARVAYLDGPASDQEGFTRAAYLDGPNSDSENSFWTEWLGAIAPTVEVLIVRHGVPIEKVDAEWTRLHSLGIVVHTKGTHVWDREATVDNYRFLTDDVIGGYCDDEEDEEEDDHDWDTRDADEEDEWYQQARARYGAPTGSRHKILQEAKACAKPSSIGAPNLRFLFFPSSKASDAATLAALRQDYPALALYCVVDRSFYWHRKGVPVSNAPLEHVQRTKSGVVMTTGRGEKRAKNVREKMHSVNLTLVEGYCAEEDEMYALTLKEPNNPPDAVGMLPAPIWFRIFRLLHQPPSQPDDPAVLAHREAPEDPAAKAARLAAREAEWIRTPGFTAWQPWGHPASSAGLTAWGQLGQPASSAGLTSQLGQLSRPANITGLTSQPSQPACSTGVTAQLGLPANSTGITAQLGLPANSTGITAQLGLPASSTGLTAQLGLPANSTGLTAQLGLPANSTGLTAWGQVGHPASSAVRALQMFYAEFGLPGHSGSSAGLTAWDWQGDPARSTQRGTGTRDHLINTRVDRKPPVVFLKEGLTASEQHEKNSSTYGASWALLCCALASKRLFKLVVCHEASFHTSAASNLPFFHVFPPHALTIAAWLKPICKLTLEHADFESLSFQFLGTITPQLHEFTLYEDGNISRLRDAVGGSTLPPISLAFSFSNARLLRFCFAKTELQLTLTVSPSLESLSVMAKWLVLSCKSTAPLALHHLSLYGQERLVISSLRLASARVAYLDGPGKDQDAIKARMRARRRMKKAFPKPPPICAPNLRFLFFPTRKACNAPALAALRQDYPALALYCVVDRSFYWHRKGKTVSNGPLEHVRSEKSGVWDEEEGKRAKNVREKMHSVKRKLVEGYCAGEDQMYVVQYQ